MKVVIMAGGRGTRIASVNAEVPKPMIEIAGKPILHWQIECLCAQGYTDIILSVGHLSHIIQTYFGDGSAFGVSIAYVVETEPLGTAGALHFLRGRVQEDFLLLNGDLIFDVDIGRFYERHKALGGMATLLTHPNDHPYDSGIILADDSNRVTEWLHKEDARTFYRNRVNAGLHFLSPAILDLFVEKKRVDLDRDILQPMIASGTLFAYDSPEYIKDVGTPGRFFAVEQDIKDGIVHGKNLANRQRAVFLDRDGTLNKYVGFLRDIDTFELVDGAADFVRRINAKGYLAIVVTNQPVIARGEVTTEQLETIHNKMETLLGQQGAYVDAIYYCPHHPHSGYAGERPEYKIDCTCRKPKPGMLLDAAHKYNIDLAASYMVGDSDADMEAGRAAGCTPVRATTNAQGKLCLSLDTTGGEPFEL